MDKQAVLARLVALEKQRQSQGLLINAIRDEFFDKQLQFVDDPAREKGALCTRRAGKTAMWVRYCTIIALTVPRGLIRIWGVTRLRGKQLLWEEFRDLFRRHRLKPNQDYVLNETELTIKFANGAEIRLLGADKDKEVQKKRGDKTCMEVVVEAQLFGAYLKGLVEDVAGPCLFDMKGTFCLEGTPGVVCGGYWYEVSGREDFKSLWTSPGGKEGVGAGWSMHHWSVLDNPHIPHAREELRLMKLKRRWADDNPTYVREWLGRWVNDLSALYYAFDPVRNTFTLEEVQPWGPGWTHVLGWDLGSRDDMALVVWGYHPQSPTLFEAFSWKEPGALSARVVEVIRGLESRFNITQMFADTGGGGRMYVEDVAARYGMNFQPAKKAEKYEHVLLFNDDLRGGFLKLQQGSLLAEEMAQLPKYLDWMDENPDKLPREHPGYPNHCCDASLYSWRGAYHFLHEGKPALAVPGTMQALQAELDELERRVEERARREENPELYPDDDFEEWNVL